MLVYIIDGCNLAHKIPSLKKSSNFQYGLIQYIKNYKLTGSKNNKVIVIFDGYPKTYLSEPGFQVIFSNEKSADSIIENKVSSIKNKQQVIVVSDDRQIRDFIRRLGVRNCRVSDFLTVKKSKSRTQEKTKDISYSLAREITEELRKVWLKE